MGYLDNLAQSLIGTTLMPRQETKGSAALSGAVTEFGKSFQKELEPFRKQKRTDIIEHEYAADPYRLDLTKKLAAIGGNKSWGILAGQLEEARDAVLNYRKKVTTKIEAQPVAPSEEPKVFQLEDLKPKEIKSISGYDITKTTKGTYAYKKSGEKNWLPSKKGITIKKLGILEKAPVIMPKVQKTDERQKDFKTLDELEHNLKVLEKKFNSIVPGRSEIEKLYNVQLQLFGATRRDIDAGAGKKMSDKYKLQYKEYMDQIDSEVTKMQKMGMFMDEDAHVVKSALVDLAATASDEDVEDGLIFSLKNSLINILRNTGEESIDNILDKNDIEIAEFSRQMNDPKNITKPIKRDMLRYLMLATKSAYAIPGISKELVLKTLANKIGIEAFTDASMSTKTYHGNANNVTTKFLKDFSVMVDSTLKRKLNKKGKDYKEELVKKGKIRFQEYTKKLGTDSSWKRFLVRQAKILTGGVSKRWFDVTTPENIRKIIRKKLVDDWRKYKGTDNWNILDRVSRGY